MIAAVVLVLCTLTSVACAGLLIRGYRASRTRLLLWSSLGFVGLALNNIFLVVDQLLVPEVDLRVVRLIPAFLGVSIMLIGCIVDAD